MPHLITARSWPCRFDIISSLIVSFGERHASRRASPFGQLKSKFSRKNALPRRKRFSEHPNLYEQSRFVEEARQPSSALSFQHGPTRRGSSVLGGGKTPPSQAHRLVQFPLQLFLRQQLVDVGCHANVGVAMSWASENQLCFSDYVDFVFLRLIPFFTALKIIMKAVTR
jgi:hypothetical protein